ncbi:MAG: glucose-6-phosphate isomerase, partial [Treponema sp.]|nr:glucose-6-phosphate isomerase [Treponema sp.]
MRYTDFDKTTAYRKLKDYSAAWKIDFKAVLLAGRVQQSLAPMAGGLVYSWAAKAIDSGAILLLQSLADEQELIAKYKTLLNGEVVNTGEKRKVLHHLSRGEQGQPVIENGKNIGEFYRAELQRFGEFADAVHNGKFKGSTGKNFTTVVQIGIGG